MSQRGRTTRGHRGSILLVVLVVVTIAALTGTTAMYLGEAGMTAEGVALKRIQSRALAWSGVQAVMAELADQREALLDGRPPVLEEQWELFSDPSGTRGIIRLISLGESPATPEGAKLDINTATAEMLAKIPGLSGELSAAIVAERGGRPYSSVDDLLRVKGITPEMLREGSTDQEPAPGTPDPLDGPAVGGLAEYLTVFSFDPNIQCGLGDGGADHRGKLRVNLDTEWSDRLASAIDERFGEGASRGVKGLIDGGTKFKTCGDMIRAAARAGLKAGQCAPVLDVFTVSDDPFLLGKVDLNTARAEVLAAIPGISPEAADQIVQVRQTLSEDQRVSVTWPAAEGILTDEEFIQAVDHLTTRSMQWRVRVEAGTVRASDAEESGGLDEATLSDRIVLEAVIDVASERPRVAYLRDVTLEEMAGALRSSVALALAELEETQEPAPEPEPEVVEAPPPSFGDLNLGQPKQPDPIVRPATSPVESESQGPPAPAAAGGGSPGQGTDRRLGRWTTGKGTGAGG